MKKQFIAAVLSAGIMLLSGCGSSVMPDSTAKAPAAQETQIQEKSAQETQIQEKSAQETQIQGKSAQEVQIQGKSAQEAQIQEKSAQEAQIQGKSAQKAQIQEKPLQEEEKQDKEAGEKEIRQTEARQTEARQIEARQTQARQTQARQIEARQIEVRRTKELRTADVKKNPVLYEYYLTEKELLSDIEKGIIFRVDTAFRKPMIPVVTGGSWSFYAYEDNVVNLDISYSNLIAKGGRQTYPIGEQVVVDVISPDGRQVYHFEKLGDEIMQDTSVQEQIAVTPGEWTLQISFVYICDEAPSNFRVCAAYEAPSKEDIRWLREARLGGYDAGKARADAKKSALVWDAEHFRLTEPNKEFLERICKTVSDFDGNVVKDKAFWKDFLFYAYTGLWEDEAEIVKVPRADLGFEEPAVKVSLEEAQAYAKLVFGETLPDYKPAFDAMTDGQTSFFYQDGYYYIGASDFPDFQYRFADAVVCEGEGGVFAVAAYSIDFEGVCNVGTVYLTLVPAENENGFVVIAKKQVLFS